MLKLLKKILLYITNNQEKSQDEEIFDVVFFIINTIALIGGFILFLNKNEPQWIPVLVIEYSWALDNMRHNRL